MIISKRVGLARGFALVVKDTSKYDFWFPDLYFYDLKGNLLFKFPGEEIAALRTHLNLLIDKEVGRESLIITTIANRYVVSWGNGNIRIDEISGFLVVLIDTSNAKRILSLLDEIEN